jgi:hypothetical protein
MKAIAHTRGVTFWQQCSPATRASISAFIWIQLVGVAIGLWFSRVVVSDSGVIVGLVVGTLCGVGWVAFIETSIRTSDPDTPAMKNIRQQRPLRSALFRVPFMFVIGLGFGYATAAWALVWTVNMWLGTPASQIVTVTGWHTGGARSCTRPEIGHFLFRDSPRSLCVQLASRTHMPDGSKLRLVGKESMLGINVDEIYAEGHAP